MIQTSEQIGELSAALAKAQAEIENVEKTGTNPGFKRGNEASRYATLGAALDEVRHKFAQQGIAILQMPINGEGSTIGVATRLAHSSGQWIESTLYVAPSKFDAQGAGSVITYLRRYALMAMAGIAPEDDDGNAASIASPQPRPQNGNGSAARPAPAPRQAPAAVPATRADEPPEVMQARTAARAAFWKRDSYEVNPEVVEGGMAGWDREMLALVDNAPTLDAVLKLEGDNREYFPKWAASVAKPVLDSFHKRFGAAKTRLRMAEERAA